MFNFRKRLYYGFSCLLGFVYTLALIFILITVPVYINSTNEVQETLNFFYTMIVAFFAFTSFIVPFMALIVIGIELFLTGKLSLKIRENNLLLSILKFTVFLIFHTVIIIMFLANIIIYGDVFIFIMKNLITVALAVIFLYFTGRLIRKRIHEEKHEEIYYNVQERIQQSVDPYRNQIIEPQNNFDIIIFSILLYLLLIHYFISGVINIIEHDILKGQITVQTKKNFFEPEQKVIEYIKLIKSQIKIIQ